MSDRVDSWCVFVQREQEETMDAVRATVAMPVTRESCAACKSRSFTRMTPVLDMEYAMGVGLAALEPPCGSREGTRVSPRATNDDCRVNEGAPAHTFALANGDDAGVRRVQVAGAWSAAPALRHSREEGTRESIRRTSRAPVAATAITARCSTCCLISALPGVPAAPHAVARPPNLPHCPAAPPP